MKTVTGGRKRRPGDPTATGAGWRWGRAVGTPPGERHEPVGEPTTAGPASASDSGGDLLPAADRTVETTFVMRRL
ncbi:hypothetical protein [Saliphagus infecundisoli]|uniref:Uncharacterized protein n=1 Tax=Saliphagus infecundisoli TaxID=1849069 RepID=A0ABD5QHX6_9EURY|nr:hypothetical protein [Saliphagus infecundisoli]